jgi:hypothetical protein
MKKERNIQPSTGGTSTREKMLARKKQLESKSNGGGFIYPKEGTLRMRIKSPGDDQELGMELITFYLGGEMGSIISPATFDEPCPFMEKYKELKESSDDTDKELAKEKFIPRRKYVIGGVIYTDEKGKSLDYDGKDKAVQIPRSVYQDIIDLYLDEDEAGDMTDPINGYDIKIIRTGSGKMDTTYSARACKPTKLDSKYRGNIDLEVMVRAQVKSYDELQDILSKYLNESSDDGDESEEVVEKPKKKKKKKYKSDI